MERCWISSAAAGSAALLGAAAVFPVCDPAALKHQPMHVHTGAAGGRLQAAIQHMWMRDNARLRQPGMSLPVRHGRLCVGSRGAQQQSVGSAGSS